MLLRKSLQSLAQGSRGDMCRFAYARGCGFDSSRIGERQDAANVMSMAQEQCPAIRHQLWGVIHEPCGRCEPPCWFRSRRCPADCVGTG